MFPIFFNSKENMGKSLIRTEHPTVSELHHRKLGV